MITVVIVPPGRIENSSDNSSNNRIEIITVVIAPPGRIENRGNNSSNNRIEMITVVIVPPGRIENSSNNSSNNRIETRNKQAKSSNNNNRMINTYLKTENDRNEKEQGCALRLRLPAVLQSNYVMCMKRCPHTEHNSILCMNNYVHEKICG